MLAFPWIVLATGVLAPTAFSAAKPLDEAIERAISEKRMPGAVVVVGHDGDVVYRKAYGDRALEPTVERMTLDTIFDVASLTKVIATTACLMKLYEDGKFGVDDRIVDTIPEFQSGMSEVTIRNLMTHFSGLRPDVPLTPRWAGYDTGIRLACSDPPATGPGIEHVYSDINFILLGELVHRLSGRSLAEFSRESVFQPLGMRDTMFQPPANLLPRVAPTEIDPNSGLPFRGVVHDPTSRNMGGVAGHAGLFSTGDDLAKFAQAMLNRGVLKSARVFDEATVALFTQPQTPVGQPILRGLGWDIDSPYSSCRGKLFPIGSYGHTGFTGTSLWIDPASQSYVILLTNAVHPRGHGSILELRAHIATIVASAVGYK